jgi:hypothetical protein
MRCASCRKQGKEHKFHTLAPGLSVCKYNLSCFTSSRERALRVLNGLFVGDPRISQGIELIQKLDEEVGDRREVECQNCRKSDQKNQFEELAPLVYICQNTDCFIASMEVILKAIDELSREDQKRKEFLGLLYEKADKLAKSEEPEWLITN